MKNDPLIEIFQRLLNETHLPNESASELIRRVAGTYAQDLFREASVPLQFLDDMLHDLEQETLEIYRKTTYGCLSLQEYRYNKAKNKKTC